MKFNKHILEAINKGVRIALDDYEDIENELSSKSDIIQNDNEIANIIDNFVNLGLPSGTLWGKYNLGVNPKKLKPNDPKSYCGNYYAWGELQPKKEYTWETYKFLDHIDKLSNGLEKRFVTKYNSEDNILVLQREDNVAQILSGNSHWNLPTPIQVQELIDNTTLHIIDAGMGKPYHPDYIGYTGDGWVLTSNINGKSIFFPNAGVFLNKRIKYHESPLTGIWTNHISTGGSIANDQSKHSCADCLVFNKYTFQWADRDKANYRIFGQFKYEGLPIRPVYNR